MLTVCFFIHVRLLKVIVRFWRFLKNCYKVAKLKDDIIKHRLNPILRRLKLL